MTGPVRLRRSALYMPASNPRAIDKARGLDADVIILDLEDAVAPEVKAEARARAVTALAEGGFGHREVVVRVNAIASPWGADDLAAVVASGANAVLVPKLSSVEEFDAYAQALSAAPPTLALWGMIETTRAVFALADLANAARGSRLSTWVVGTNDLAREMNCRLTPDRAPLWAPLSLAVAAARMGGLPILDGVHNDIEDTEGFEAACRQAVEFGFDGKTLIHPRQIEACHRAFTPMASEIAAARRIIEAFDRPENADKGAISLDGRMVERLHLDGARRTLAQAEAIEGRSA
jgi:citrate lyase subunit beta/citryl-CoA lyase